MILENQIKDGWHHYHATVSWITTREIKKAALGIVGKQRKSTVIIHAPSANSALHQVHQAMQKAKELNSFKEVVRPMLLPTEYTVIDMHIPYNDATGNPHKHVFDIPASANPDMADNKIKGHQPSFMPFFDEVKGVGALAK